jgi:hypothetical protein
VSKRTNDDDSIGDAPWNTANADSGGATHAAISSVNKVVARAWPSDTLTRAAVNLTTTGSAVALAGSTRADRKRCSVRRASRNGAGRIRQHAQRNWCGPAHAASVALLHRGGGDASCEIAGGAPARRNSRNAAIGRNFLLASMDFRK